MIALLTFAGTWAEPGTGYPSDVARDCADIVEEVPVQAPWSFGPIPPGALTSPSYKESVAIAVDNAVNWLLLNPTRDFMLGGYSQGAEAAARVYGETLDGRLSHMRHLYCGGFTFGNPSRQLEHTFYAGPPRDGEGIAGYRMSGMGIEWADECDVYDIYAGVPPTLTGEIMRDVYTLCTDLQIHDMAQFVTDLAANMVELLGNLDGDAYGAVQRGARKYNIDLSGSEPVDVAPLRDKYLSVKGIAAAVQACILGLQFLCWQPPTAPHIQYSIREVFPGQTYLQHAVQHVNHWVAERNSG